MRRYYPWEDLPEGPLEPQPPLSTGAWLWAVAITLHVLAVIGAVFA
jgi:hypothetical protein